MAQEPHIDPSVQFYVDHPAIAAEYDDYFSANRLFRYDTAFVLDRVQAGSRVLDVGCGTGRHLLPLARRGCRVTGLDLSRHMLAETRNKLRDAGASAQLVRADMRFLPLAPGTRFDFILLMFSTLGLVRGDANRAEILRSLAAHLAPGGEMLLHVHNDNYRFSPNRGQGARLMGLLDTITHENIEDGDHVVRGYRGIVDLRLHSFTIRELARLFAAAGVRPVHFEGLNDTRDGTCASDNPDAEANGFLIAVKRQSSAR